MGLYLAKRLLSLLLTLLFTSVVVFGVLEVLPGNAAQVMLGPDASPEAVAELSRQLGLHLPVHTRYLAWAGGLLQGDMGISHAYSSPVWPLIAERLALTIPLAVFAMLITSVLALVIGIYAASRHNKPADIAVMGISQIGMAVPNFWFAIVLILVFSVQLQWFSAGGFDGWRAGFWSGLQSLLLPAIALAVVQTAILARITRSSVLEVMQEDFVRTARARGLSERATLWRHVLRNAMIPVVTMMGLQFGFLLGGSIVVEVVFNWPGMGRLLVDAVEMRDYPIIQALVLLFSLEFILINLVVDLLYAWINPTIRYK